MNSNLASSGVAEGSVVAETYKVVRILGRGGMGAVWEAHHMRLPGKRVAIKVLHASVAEDQESLARFKREAEIACRLGHPNIVEVHDYNKLEDGSPYLILELLEGESLDARLRKKGRLEVGTCESILRQISSALQCAHAQGVIHRDLKPQNIFLVPSPTGVGPEIVKVLDFGISKIRGSNTVKTQDSTLLGTPQYMAPEQAIGDHKSIDGRTDIFSLGAMLYELLSGQPAFPGQNIPEVVYKVVHVAEEPLAQRVTGLAPNQSAAVHKALSKARNDRFATVADFVLAFSGQELPPLQQGTGTHPTAEAFASTLDSSKRSLRLGRDLGFGKRSLALDATLASGKRSLALDATLASGKRSLAIGEAGDVPGGDEPLAPQSEGGSGDQPAALIPTSENVATAASASPAETLPGPHAKASRSATWRWLGPGAAAAAGALAVALFLGRETPSDTPTKALAGAQRGDTSTTVTTATPGPLPDASNSPDLARQATDAASTAVVADAGRARAGDTSVSVPAKDSRRQPPKKGERQATERARQAAAPAEVTSLLERAKTHLASGQLVKAIALARKANRLQETKSAYRIQARAFCQQGDQSQFNGALRNVSPAMRRKLRRLCSRYNKAP